MNTTLPARKRGRPPGTTRPSKPDKKVKTGISMKPAEWTDLDKICRIYNTNRGILIASLVREKIAQLEGHEGDHISGLTGEHDVVLDAIYGECLHGHH